MSAIPCECGEPAMWRGSRTGQRIYSCANCYAVYQNATPPQNPSETPRCHAAKVDAGYIIASHSEGEFVPLEIAQGIERELNTHMHIQNLLGAEFEGADDVEACVTALRSEKVALERRATLAERRCGELEASLSYRFVKGIRALAGHVEDGTSLVVTIFQDDATKEWFAKVGHQEFHASTFLGLAIALTPKPEPKGETE